MRQRRDDPTIRSIPVMCPSPPGGIMLTRRTVIFGFAVMPVVLTAAPALAAMPKPDTLGTSAGDVTIQPLNHATLVLRQGSHVIYLDPAKVDFTGQPAPTAIFITHEHGD